MTVISLKGHSMSRNHRHKPSPPRRISDPAESARRGVSPDSWGVNEDALKLKANADVDTRQDRDVEGKRRVRYDIFARMYYRGTPEQDRAGRTLGTPDYDAVRRLQADVAVLHRTQGAMDAIRATGAGQMGALAVVTEDFSHARVLAGDRVDEVLAGMAWVALDRVNAEREAKGLGRVSRVVGYGPMMRDLAEAEAVRGSGNWQGIVVSHTEERRHLAMYEHVRVGSRDLAESYRRIDNEPRERVA
jgi:hypothetical protein